MRNKRPAKKHIPVDKSKLKHGMPERINDPPYRADFNGKECAICESTETTVGGHSRHGLKGGMGLKPSDTLIMPLCDPHHKEEAKDQVAFWWKYKRWTIDEAQEEARQRYRDYLERMK